MRFRPVGTSTIMPIVSAGIAFIRNNKILLVHPTKTSWKGTFGIPKGRVEEGEGLADAAVRETFEEIGISIDPLMISSEPKTVLYKNKGKHKVRKIVHYFVVDATDLDIPDVIPKEQLQLEEVDWAGFLSKKEARKKIFWRFEHLLDDLLE